MISRQFATVSNKLYLVQSVVIASVPAASMLVIFVCWQGDRQ